VYVGTTPSKIGFLVDRLPPFVDGVQAVDPSQMMLGVCV
jgi:hypothetical protein